MCINKKKINGVTNHINIYMKLKHRLNWDRLTEKLIQEPFTLLHDKLDIIIKVCEENNVKELLEVGTFAGGSAYILGKSLPNASIKSIDINDFAKFFHTGENDNILRCIKNYFPDLRPRHLHKIQCFYSRQLPNITFQNGILRNLDISYYDAIILDGDHRADGLLRDLKYVLKNNNKCIIFIDDTSHKHIKDTVESICNKKFKHVKLQYDYDNDLAIITRRIKK
jgi:hypothetical protein